VPSDPTRVDLDRQMRAVLAQLETCSHVSAAPWGPTGRSPSSDEPQGGGRPPGDIGHTYYAREYGPPFHAASTRHPGAPDDAQRARIIDRARGELEHLRGQAELDRPEPESLEQLRARIVKQGEGWTVEKVALAMRCGERLVLEARKAAGREPDYGRVLEPAEKSRRRVETGRFQADASAVERRRRQLSDLIDRRGYTLANAARVLGISRSTAERDLGRRAA
jgi:hypothetical protein